MAFPGRIITLGRSRFTAVEAQFLMAGIRRGVTRSSLRAIFRQSLGRGFSNEAFAAGGRILSESEAAGRLFLRLQGPQRIALADIPAIAATQARSRFMVSALVRARVPWSGEVVSKFIRYGTDTLPSPDSFQRRAQEILDLGTSGGTDRVEYEETPSLTIVMVG